MAKKELENLGINTHTDGTRVGTQHQNANEPGRGARHQRSQHLGTIGGNSYPQERETEAGARQRCPLFRTSKLETP